MSKQTLKIAFASCGGVAQSLAECFRGLDAEIVAVADPEAPRRKKLFSYYRIAREYEDYREMLTREKPDLVICAKDMSEPLDDYHQMAKDCLTAGAWAFAERPVSMTSAQARELCDLQKRTGCYVGARFQRRFSTAYLTARSIINEPAFGKPLVFAIKGDTAPYASDADFIDKHLSHYLDLACMYFDGLRVAYVNAFSPGPKKYGYQVSLCGPDGLIGTIQSVSFQSQAYPIERLEILSDGKAVIVENASVVHSMRPSAVDGSLNPAMNGGSDIQTFLHNRAHMTTTALVRFNEYFAHVLDCIRKGVPPVYHMEHVLPAVELLEDFKRVAGK